MMSYEKLDVYKVAMEFLTLTLQIVQQLPPGYADLGDQLRRAAMSTPQNIGEGTGKRTSADCRKYFDNARGSAMECGVHLDICAACKLVDQGMIEHGKAMLEREVAMLTRLSESQGTKIHAPKSKRPPLAERSASRR
jgi:four helix bundle protein